MTTVRPPCAAQSTATQRFGGAGTVIAAVSVPRARPLATCRVRRLVAAALLMGGATATQAQWSARAISSVCDFETCDYDYRSGDTAQASIGRLFQYVESDGSGGYNYSGFSSSAVGKSSFALFADAGGSTTANVSGGIANTGLIASSVVFHQDEVTLPGTGLGTMVVPWHITGSFNIRALGLGDLRKPSAKFGVPFCQSIAVGAASGGVGCSGGGSESFDTSSGYDKVVQLVFPIQFGVATALNSHFELQVLSGAGLASAATADFSHTGLMLPASVYDSSGVLLPDVVITAASGLDYRHPQGIAAVPEPHGGLLLLSGLGWLAFAWRRRASGTARRLRQAGWLALAIGASGPALALNPQPLPPGGLAALINPVGPLLLNPQPLPPGGIALFRPESGWAALNPQPLPPGSLFIDTGAPGLDGSDPERNPIGVGHGVQPPDFARPVVTPNTYLALQAGGLAYLNPQPLPPGGVVAIVAPGFETLPPGGIVANLRPSDWLSLNPQPLPPRGLMGFFAPIDPSQALQFDPQAWPSGSLLSLVKLGGWISFVPATPNDALPADSLLVFSQQLAVPEPGSAVLLLLGGAVLLLTVQRQRARHCRRSSHADATVSPWE